MQNTVHVIHSKNRWVLKREGKNKTLTLLGLKTFKFSEIAFYYATLIATTIIVHEIDGTVKFLVLTSMLTRNFEPDEQD